MKYQLNESAMDLLASSAQTQTGSMVSSATDKKVVKKGQSCQVNLSTMTDIEQLAANAMVSMAVAVTSLSHCWNAQYNGTKAVDNNPNFLG